MENSLNTTDQELLKSSGNEALQCSQSAPGLKSDNTEEEFKRLSVIFELTKASLSVNNFNELLEKISEQTTKLFNASGCMILLIEDGSLKIKALYGFPQEMRAAFRVRLGDGCVGKAASERKTIFAQDPADFGLLMEHINMQTALCTPLIIHNQVMGTFGLYDKKMTDNGGKEVIVPFTSDDQITLEGFASIAAIVIEKSILYEDSVKKEKEAIVARQQFENLWDSLQGFIENSSDAIIATDVEGIVASWNRGAEKIYGYKSSEVIGNYLPFIPDFLRETEKSYLERVKNGQTIKDIETVRKTKNGLLLDVSLALSPIKDASARVVGISGISRDITEKKRIEKDLISKNAVLSKLMLISSAMRGTLELDKLLRMVLTAVTMGDGLGFNRAMLFLVDESKKTLRGAMGVGPSSHEEAWKIWSSITSEQKNLASIMEDIEVGPLSKDSFMDRLCCGVEVSLESDTILTRTVKEKRALNVTNVHAEPLSDPILIQQLGTPAYAVLPLISRDKVIGVLWVDNIFTNRPISDLDMAFLKGFSDQMASAVENARLFEHVAQAEQELENIFESISDLVYFTRSDYTIKKVNKAVLARVGKPLESIIDKKCYEIFHGTGQPLANCPHHKTIETGKSFIEEFEDPYLGGTFLASSSPIFDNTGALVGTVLVLRDISEMKELQEKASTADRMSALGAMAAKVAHEIRNPLLSVGGFARRIEKRLDGDLKEYSKIIVDEVSRLEWILNDVLSFVKSAPVKKTAVDLSEVIDHIVKLIEPAVILRGNKLTKVITEPVTVLGDRDRIKEVLLNLLTNANEATENGNIIIKAGRHSTFSKPDLSGHAAETSEVLVEISDNGCGIKEEDINRIFDPFFTTRPSGTGLGLSITKRIIEEHGGNIEVESTWGKGTRFKIYMPLQEE